MGVSSDGAKPLDLQDASRAVLHQLEDDHRVTHCQPNAAAEIPSADSDNTKLQSDVPESKSQMHLDVKISAPATRSLDSSVMDIKASLIDFECDDFFRSDLDELDWMSQVIKSVVAPQDG